MWNMALTPRNCKQESVRPRWPYDMRPSVRAEKYIRDASGWRKDVTDGNDNGTDGQTDRQTDRVRRNMRPPPREEGRIKRTPTIPPDYHQNLMVSFVAHVPPSFLPIFFKNRLSSICVILLANKQTNKHNLLGGGTKFCFANWHVISIFCCTLAVWKCRANNCCTAERDMTDRAGV